MAIDRDIQVTQNADDGLLRIQFKGIPPLESVIVEDLDNDLIYLVTKGELFNALNALRRVRID